MNRPTEDGYRNLTRFINLMTVPAPFSTERAAYRYLPLMHELGIRIDLVAKASHGQLSLSPPYAREYAYLQFRRICELIALGCVELHGDLPLASSNAVKTEWHAERIMKLLQKNHEDCFPKSTSVEDWNGGYKYLVDTKSNALSFSDFKKLYNECGEVLHRGTIKSISTSQAITDSDLARVPMWHSKIIDLLDEHVIWRANRKGFYYTAMRMINGCPECTIFTHDGKTGFDVRKCSLELNVSVGGGVIDLGSGSPYLGG